MSKKTTNNTEEVNQEAVGPLSWKPEDKIEMTGIEFHALNRVLELFEVAIMAKNSILSRMVKDGIAKRVVNESMAQSSPNDVAPEDNSVPTTEVVEPLELSEDQISPAPKMEVAYKAD